MTDTTSQLGTVITSVIARKIIYGTYVVAGVVLGAIQAAFSGDGASPHWLDIALRVLAYVGVPIAGLAIANAPKTLK